MWYILYNVNIHYKEGADFNVSKYTLFARDEENARSIAEELFYISYGRIVPMQTLVKPKPVRKEIADSVLNIAHSYYKEFETLLTGKDYTGFLDCFLSYNGFGLAFGSPHFYIRFNPVCLRIDFTNGICSVNPKVRVEYDGNVYVVENLEKVYIARGE